MQKFFPNIITISRLVLAITILILIGRTDRHNVSSSYLDTIFGLFLLAMTSDWLDGYLARKFHAKSQLGRMLDPFVDKVLICGMFVLLCGADWSEKAFLFSGDRNGIGLAPWMTLIIILRELLVSLLRGFGEAAGLDYSAKWIGKIKLLIQTTTLAIILFVFSHLRNTTWCLHFRDACILITMILTVYSSVAYLRMTFGAMISSNSSKKNPPPES